MKWGVWAFAAFFLAGCSKSIDTPEAVKQGVIRDLSKRVDVQNMDVNVNSVSFRGKEAEALVSFAPKGGNPSSGLTMRYTLEREGNEWRIKGRSQGDLNRHTQGMTEHPGEGGQMQLPPGHPALGGNPQSESSATQPPAGGQRKP
ncbi:MAG: hypothetical protein JO022_12315 [Acidobacteriaceae bacterium]|nr:hypothetical protein [Acidobacteriaceae bacterium]